MTPFRIPMNEAKQRYNNAHSSARNIVEICISVLGTRFRCLLKEHTACYDPDFVTQFVNICAALHNLCHCIDGGINIDNEYEVSEDVNAQHGPLGNHHININQTFN